MGRKSKKEKEKKKNSVRKKRTKSVRVNGIVIIIFTINSEFEKMKISVFFNFQKKVTCSEKKITEKMSFVFTTNGILPVITCGHNDLCDNVIGQLHHAFHYGSAY